VLANGDIDSPEKALEVLQRTSADGLMIGRGAQGRPWLFAQIRDFFDTGRYREPELPVIRDTILSHIADMHAFYGEHNGVRIARKHLRWYFERIDECNSPDRRRVLTETSAARQLELAGDYFDCCVSATAMSIASIQCLTGTSVPLARCS
jgi:tRNA-dihydrouridine synthase B